MPFTIVTGSMGGGKSYLAVEEMLKAIKEGAIVHTNLDLIREKWTQYTETEDQIIELKDDPTGWKDQIVPGIEGQENVLIIDEGALIFNAQDWAKGKTEKQEIFKLMVYSRHLGLDVFFISQDAKNVDAQVRRMAVSQIHCRNVKEIKPFGFIFANLPPPLGGTFRRHRTDFTGRHVHHSTWSTFDPKIGELYRTHARASRVTDKERDVRRRKNVDQAASGVKRGAVILIGVMLAIVAGIWFAGSRAYAVFSPDPPPAAAPTPPIPPTREPEAKADGRPPSLQVERPVVEPRFVARRGTGIDHAGRRYVDLAEGTATLGSVFRDAVVTAFSIEGEFISIHLDNGKTVVTRRGHRSDFPSFTPTKLEPWKKSQSPPSPFSVLSRPE